MIFVDTGAWYAAFVENDPDHVRAEVVLAAPGERLLTTDYVLDELFTLALSSFKCARALLGQDFARGFIAKAFARAFVE